MLDNNIEDVSNINQKKKQINWDIMISWHIKNILCESFGLTPHRLQVQDLWQLLTTVVLYQKVCVSYSTEEYIQHQNV